MIPAWAGEQPPAAHQNQPTSSLLALPVLSLPLAVLVLAKKCSRDSANAGAHWLICLQRIAPLRLKMQQRRSGVHGQTIESLEAASVAAQVQFAVRRQPVAEVILGRRSQ